MAIADAEILILETLGDPTKEPVAWNPVTDVYKYVEPYAAPATYSYRSKSAELVWEFAQALIVELPDLSGGEILRLAIEKSGVMAMDLASEDWRMLELAVEWLQLSLRRGALPTTGRPYVDATLQKYDAT